MACNIKVTVICQLCTGIWRVLVVCTSHDLQYQGPCHLSIVFSGVSLSSVLVMTCNIKDPAICQLCFLVCPCRLYLSYPIIFPSCIPVASCRQQGQCILFSVVFTASPLSHHGSICLLPFISLLLTYTVSPVRACLSKWLELFRGTQKKTSVGLFVFNSLYLQGLNSWKHKSLNTEVFFTFLEKR